MMGSRASFGTADARTSKGTPPVTARPAANGIPRHAAARAAERSPASTEKTSSPSADRRSPKMASRVNTPPSAESPQKQGSAVKKQSMELQAQLAAIQEELKSAKEQLAEKEMEHHKVADDARRTADEANAKLRDALAALKKAEEASETEMFRAVELEQTSIESAQRKQELQRRLDATRRQQEADAAALRSTVAELEEARLELADAIDAKNLALGQAGDALRASEASAAKVERLNAEISRLRESFDSELESRVKESAEKTRKLEAEASVLRIKLKKAKVTEEKVAELEAVVEGLRADVAIAIQARRDADESAAEWKKKAELLEIKLEVANQSSILKAESLSSVTMELNTANASLQEKESQLSLLQRKVESLEHEVVKQNEDINASGQRVDAAQREASGLRAEIHDLRSRLRAMEQEKADAIINHGSSASSQIDAIREEKDRLARELEHSRDECEKVRDAMEDLASALQEMSAEARDSRERYLGKQEEIELARARIEELSVSLNNSREHYEVMLDEANYERVCLKNKVEQLEAEAKNSSEELRSKELSFATSVTNSEEEIVSMRIQLGNAAQTARDLEKRNAQLEQKLRELEEAQVAAANRGSSRDAKAACKQNNEQQQNDGLHAKESSAGSEKIRDLYSLIGSDRGDTEKDGAPVLLVSKMWENSKIADYNLSKERDDGEPEADALDSTNRDSASDGTTHGRANNSNTKLVIKQNQQKKALMKKFGGLLKKKSQH
ncbi:WEB family protein At3g02930, chloroplastic-like isoform X1 [Oryza brachyantha]|uniref:WEB family protein At3g02930, chloroplastic-like isoform X1 n=1 Tax=Oryza brachyantha TaxID=4533 RepID=UPI000776133E|nr:WEB family protein At3g02930, chloroplastic-like isoform X1 [Oryza brachyantha]